MEEDSESWLVKTKPFYFDPCKQGPNNKREPKRFLNTNAD